MMIAILVVMLGLVILLAMGTLATREACDHRFVLFTANDYGTHRAAVYACERCGATLNGQA